MPNVSQTTRDIAAALATFDIEISTLASKQMTNDSRQVKSGDIFCAVIGDALDGRKFIDNAIAQGACLVIAQCQHSQQHGKIITKNGIKVVQFYALAEQLFSLAARYYQTETQQLNVVGITGTNGKTSTALMTAQLLTSLAQQTAVIGTLGAGVLPELTALENTTPAATQVLSLLAEYEQKAINTVAMEVSSHALTQKRVLPELFDIAVFTNLSRDHLDYHGTMEEYAAAKFSLFNSSKAQQVIINGDDTYAQQWLAQNNTDNVLIFAKNPAVITQFSEQSKFAFAKGIKHLPHGVEFSLVTHLGEIDITSPTFGDFNIENLLAAISVLICSEKSLEDVQQAVLKLSPISGRMEVFNSQDKPLSVVDYAHTPDGLENALVALKQHCHGKLWLVFGCGGDRDQGKRAEMGAIAEKLADHIIVTNDNPRNEAPEMIVSDIIAGSTQPERFTIILNRQQAASSALAHAKAEDAILFAGKGHEDYIIIGNDKIPYNERALVQSYYREAVL